MQNEEDIESEMPELPIFSKVHRSVSISNENQKKIDASDYYRDYDNTTYDG